MSRRLSLEYKRSETRKPKVKFADELVFLDSIKENDVDTVRQMLRRASVNIDINKINEYGLTALHQAVLENSIELVRILIENNADVNAIDDDSWTPLHAACSMGYYDIAKMLLENKANVNALSVEGERPLDLVETGNIELISLLLNYINHISTLDEFLTKSFMNILEKYTDEQEEITADDEKFIINEISSFMNNDTHFLKSLTFLKALTSSILQFNYFGLNNKHLKELVHARVLKKFLQQSYGDEKSPEIECLNTVLDFVNKNELSEELFNRVAKVMYDEKIIGSEAVQIYKKNHKEERKQSILLTSV